MTKVTSSQQGTTLVEILIAIVSSSILIGLFMHADLAVNRSIMRWAYRSGIEQSAISVAKQLGRDILRCDSLQRTGDAELVIYRGLDASVQYSFRDSSITRDGRDLLSAKVRLVQFKLEPLVAAQDLPEDYWRAPVDAAQLLTLVLGRSGLASQTLKIPIRPYSIRHI